jgi:hypothetical protein
VEAKRVDSIEGMVGSKEEIRDIKRDMTTILEDIVGI